VTEAAAGFIPDLQAPAGRLAAALAARLEAERDRWALWIPAGFATGIGGYFALEREPAAWLGAVVLGLAVTAGILGRRRPGLLLACLALAVVAAGFAAAQFRTASVAAPVLQKRIGPVAVSGRIAAVERRAKGWRLTLETPEIGFLEPARTPARIRVVVLHESGGDFDPGQRVRLRAVLRPPPEPVAPGAYDFARRAFFQGLGGVGFAYGKVRAATGPPGGLAGDPVPARATAITFLSRTWWTRLRLITSERILAALPGESGPIAAALMTGARGAIPEATLTAMRDSGLAHLLAISGLHVGLVAGLLFFGVRALLALVPALALRYPIKKWAAAAAGLGAFAYLALTGASVPTQRAYLMVGLVLLGILLDRSALSFRLIAWAAVVVLAVAPESLLSPSFQMSFAAVAALIAAYEMLRDRWRRLVAGNGPPGGALGGVLAWAGRQVSGAAISSVVAGLATAPFAVYHFNRIAWYGLAANVVAVPLTALWIMPWALVAFALMPFGAEELALAPMGWGIEVMLAVARRVAAWPGAVSLVPVMPTGALVSIALGGLWLCLWRRPWRLLGVLPILAGALAGALAVPPDILASGDAKLMAVRDGTDGLYLSSARVRRFDAGIWRRRLGLEDSEPWPHLGQAAEGRLSCDPLGCIYRARRQVVALTGDARALADDCAVASVVISREPVGGRCKGPGLVIDRFDLWRQGGHAIWLGEKEIRVETVRAHRGVRPWVRQRGGR